jgi:hypothetical protein
MRKAIGDDAKLGGGSMSEESKIDPKHSTSRLVLRTVGPIIAGLGLVLTVIKFGSLLSSFGSSELPRYFWCAFVGLPLLGVGAAMSMFAFLGSVSRYVSGEAAPVQKDTFNYLARDRPQPGRNPASWRRICPSVEAKVI